MDSDGRTGPIDPSNDAKLHPAIYSNYGNVFRGFYNEPIDYGTSILECLPMVMGMAAVAEDLNAMHSVGAVLERALLQYDKQLWKSVADNPIAWLNLGNQIQSDSIFRQGLIHTVGKWKLFTIQQLKQLNPSLMGLLRRKVAEYHEYKKRVQMKMIGQYHAPLKETVVASRTKGVVPGRGQYGNDVYGWITLSLFRQWFGQIICEGNDYRSDDGGYRFFKIIEQGGSGFLTRGDQKQFAMTFPLTDKAMAVVEGHLSTIKEELKEIVAPLLRTNAYYSDVDWLTSVNIEEKDLPWNMAIEEFDPNEYPDPRHEDIFNDVTRDPAVLGYATSANREYSNSQLEGVDVDEVETQTHRHTEPEAHLTVDDLDEAAREDDGDEGSSSGDEPLVKERNKRKKSLSSAYSDEELDSESSAPIPLSRPRRRKSAGEATKKRQKRPSSDKPIQSIENLPPA